MTDTPKQNLSDDLIAKFTDIVGANYATSDQSVIAPHLVELRGLYQGASPLLLKPNSTEQVSDILKLANDNTLTVVPQGGNTGLVGGQVPNGDIIISLSRMNKIREVDVLGSVMVLDAGVILANAQKAAEEHNLLFPLSLGSEGTCQIGGNLSSNAGGTAVVAYGNTRELCMGLEVVLPTGEIWHGLRRLKKDNTGYDLRDLFIGAEGTLGIITGAVLKLFPQPIGREVMYVGLDSPDAALELFNIARNMCGPSLTGFELMPRFGVEITIKNIDGCRDPLDTPHNWYALIEISSGQSEEAARQMIEGLFEKAFDTGIANDAVLAESESQRKAFWHMRESMSEAQRPEGGSIKHDISVPIAKVPEFLRQASIAVNEYMPNVRICAFGHLGDGNIHYNISQPVDADKQEFLSHWHSLNTVVHAIVLEMNGSISAEHGIGQLKRDELASIREPIEIELMQRIKRSFDPQGIMNPNKLLKR
jgi:FAD/FMN-containing dehydrogenase